MLRLRGVRFAYDGASPVLDGVDLDLGPGLTLLLGPNGCGKSTLMKLVAGVEKPDMGAVSVEGRDMWAEEVAARAALAYVPEQPDLTPYATLSEVMRLVCRLRGETTVRASEALTRVGLGSMGSRSIREMSMGQRRRAVLAAAMIGSPRHFLLDEPLEAMDRGMRDDVLAWIAAHRAAGALILVVTHEIEPFVALADHALTLHDSRAVLLDTLPIDQAARVSLLESLARGGAPHAARPVT